MVIGLLAIIAIPTVDGVSHAISAQKDIEKRKADAKRMAKFHIDVYCDAPSSLLPQIHQHRLVLHHSRVYLGPIGATNPCKEGYVAEAFYIEYPDPERVPEVLGLVSQVQVDPPLLNWLYVDKDTMELRYGNKSASIEHRVGPWDWSEDEEGVEFEKDDKFAAVEVNVGGKKRWQVYWDDKENGLQGHVPKGKRKFGISLERTMIVVEEQEKK